VTPPQFRQRLGAPGLFAVLAMLAGCSSETSTAPSTTPPTVPPGSLFTNTHEPTGFSRVVDQPMTGGSVAGWATIPAGVQFAADPLSPLSPTTFGRMTYRVGMRAGVAPATTSTSSFASRNHREIYLRTAVRVSSNWYGHNTGVNKVLHLWTQNPQGNKLVISLHGAGNAPLKLRVTCQGVPDTSKCAKMMANTGASGTVSRGAWHVIEARIRLNTAGKYDGTLQLWLDGVMTHNYSNLRVDAGRWYIVSWSPTWGGVGGTVPVQQTMDMDGMYVSGR
jgi:hypothetical protein